MATALAIPSGTVKDCVDVVRDRGRVITVSGGDGTITERYISIQQFEHHPDMQLAMIGLVSDIVKKKIQLVIEEVYAFERAIAALEKTETGHARGKIVVRGL